MALLAYGDVDVTWQTVAFKKIKFATRENIGQGPVDIPAQQLQTTAFWLSPDDAVRSALKAAGLQTSEGLTGMRNLAVVALPFVAMCDSRDLGAVVNSHNTGRPTMIVYDRYPGGLGYSEKGFARIFDLLAVCREMVEMLSVRSGLPELRRLAKLAAGDPQRPGPDPRATDAGQAGDARAAGDAR